MNIIIDTHIFLWALTNPSKMDKAKRSALEDLSNTIFVSAVSIAELMIKNSIGKLEIDFDPVALAKQSGFALLEFKAEAALLLKDLPFRFGS
jgi:PIN domain nuclease of toxin-antitoxin system